MNGALPSVDINKQDRSNVMHKLIAKYRASSTRLLMTVALIFSWICLGLYSEILGSTLPTLMYRANLNYEEIGTALALRSVGLLLASVVGGLAADRWSWFRVYQLAAAVTLAAVTNIVIPFCRNMMSLCFVLFLAGCSHGTLTTSGNPLLAKTWGSRAAGPFSLMHAGYGIGAAISPPIVSQFKINVNGSLSKNETIIDPIVPYYTVAGILLICSLCFIMLGACIPAVREQNRENIGTLQSFLKSAHDQKAASSNKSFLQRIVANVIAGAKQIGLLLLGTFIIYFAVVGNERIFGKFMFTYAIEGPIKMPDDDAYLLQLLYWIFFSMSRVITFVIALFISETYILLFLSLLTVLSSGCLNFLLESSTWFFTTALIFSVSKSPLFPITLACINRSHEVNGLIVIVVNVGSAFGAIFLQYAAGSLIEDYGQSAFPYLVFATACVVLITACMLVYLLRSLGDRFESVPTETSCIKFELSEIVDEEERIIM